MSMRRTLIALALMFAAAGADAGVQTCDFDSDYDLRIAGDRLEFTRDSGAPASVVMRQGRLIVDGVEARLSAEDSRRVAEFEREARALLPEAKGIALDAVDIAFTALTEVVRGLSDDAAPTLARLEDARAELVEHVQSADGTAGFDGDFIEDTVTGLVGEVVPLIVRDVAAGAVAAALSGDESKIREFERRAERMERELEDRVETSAKSLEARAEALCPRIARLDEIEDGLAFRQPDGSALQLLRAESRRH